MRAMRAEPLSVAIRVAAADAGARLDDLLSRHVQQVSRATIRRAIIAGAVRVDHLCVRRPAWVLRAGSRVTVRIHAARLDPHRVERGIAGAALDIVYEDEWLIVVNKPAGLPTHATADPDRPHVTALVSAYLSQRHPGDAASHLGVHQRLDRETSGLVLFTVDPSADKGVAAQSAARAIEKIYLALVKRPSGQAPRRWTAEAPIEAGGVAREARTDFRVADRIGEVWLVEARPRTGRKHQIRIHLAAAGLPILGERRYAGDVPAAAPRLMLHATGLRLQHPVTGAPLVLDCAPPADFAAILSAGSSRRRRRDARW